MAAESWIVIPSHDASEPALIDAGRRCQRMWLETRARSIDVHPMSQVLTGLSGPIYEKRRVLAIRHEAAREDVTWDL